MAKVERKPTECPKCGGERFWDNRRDKKSAKSPDFRCKNKECGEPFFLAEDSPDRLDAAKAKPDPAPAPARGPLPKLGSREAWAGMARTYQRCVAIARAAWPDMEATAQVAAAATLFIEANREGLTVPAEEAAPKGERPAPAPPAAPSRREQAEARAYANREDRVPVAAGPRNGRPDPLADRSFDDFPEALQDEDDDLPF